MISTYTRNETTRRQLQTLDVLKRLHAKGITEEELKRRRHSKGAVSPAHRTSDQLATLIAQLEFYGSTSATSHLLPED